MIHSIRIFIIGILLIGLCFVPAVSADAFSAWSASGDSWIRTNDTYTERMWNASGSHSWLSTGNATTIDLFLVGSGAAGIANDGGGGGGNTTTYKGSGYSLSSPAWDPNVNANGNAIAVSGTWTITVAATATVGNDGTASTFVQGGTTYQADGGIRATSISPYPGGRGGSGGGGYSHDAGTTGDGGADGSNGFNGDSGPGGVGQGHTTREFGDGTGTMYSGGGSALSSTNQTPGGGGTGDSVAGTRNGVDGLGGGGGSGATPGTGGSGIVIIRYVSGLSPVASFTPVTATGVSPYSVAFTDTSTNTPTYWNWTVEGKIGNTTKYLNVSTSQNPSFSFLEGNYTISLGAGNADGFDISDQDSWVNVSFGGPVVSFSTNVTEGVNDLALYLNDTSTLSPTYWNTSWGDGDDSWTNQTTFPVTNITHVYSTAGEYYINQYATNPYGTANGTPLLITVYGYANSQFAVFNTLGGAPFTTYLYDTSTNTTPGATSYYWEFGDGNTSTEQNVYYTWNITGTYSVNHSFSNGLSTSWNNKSDYVVVGTSVTKPSAAFNGTPSLGANPLTEFFTDVSTNTPTEWNWSFGDGYVSTDQNPSHTYTKSGFFTVNFSATNVAGTDWMNRTNFVMVY